MTPSEKPLISQAEYMNRCLTLIASDAWRSEYRQAALTERPNMLRALTCRFSSNAESATQRTKEIVQWAAEREEHDVSWRAISSRSRQAYLNEKTSVEMLMKKEVEARRTFEETAYLLTDEVSELWSEFCILKARFIENLRQRLKSARGTKRELRMLCEERGTFVEVGEDGYNST